MVLAFNVVILKRKVEDKEKLLLTLIDLKMEKKNKNTLKSQDSDKIQLAEENLHVEKKEIETGRVKLSKKVLKEEVPIDFSGFDEEIEIDRKKVGRVVDKPGPAVRKEGDSTVYSLYKEIYVKQTVLEEEVWITKKQVHKSFQGKEKLRREVLEIERTPSKPLEQK